MSRQFSGFKLRSAYLRTRFDRFRSAIDYFAIIEQTHVHVRKQHTQGDRQQNNAEQNAKLIDRSYHVEEYR